MYIDSHLKWSKQIGCKNSIGEKKWLYKKTLDKSVSLEKRMRRVEEYKVCKNRIKQEIRESKRRVRASVVENCVKYSEKTKSFSIEWLKKGRAG